MVHVNRGQGKFDFEASELKRTTCVRMATVLAIIIIIIAFIALIIAVALLATQSTEKSKQKNICVTKSCVKAASTLLEAINTTIDPCQDFYRFTCSNWIKEHRFLNPSGAVDFWDVIQKRVDVDVKEVLDVKQGDYPRGAQLAIDFYSSCLSSAHKVDVQLLKPIFKLFGGWPIAEGDNWDEANFNFDDAVAAIVREIGASTIIDISVEVDFKNKNRNIIFIDQPEKSEEDPISDPSTKKSVATIVRLLGNNNTKQIIEDLKEMEKLEEIITSLSREDHERKDLSTLYNIMTIEELHTSFPQVNWLKILRYIFKPDKIKPNQRELLPTDEIAVAEPSYIAQILNLTSNNTFSNRTIANFLGWKIIEDMMYLFPHTEDVCLPEIHLSSEKPELTKQIITDCIEEISKYMPTALHYLYYKQNIFDENKISEMVSTLKDAFKHRVKYSDWIDKDMKKTITEKVNIMGTKIGIAKWMLDSKKLDEYYEDLPNMTKDALKNIFNIANFTAKKGIAKLYQDPSKEKWMPPESIKEVNAYNVPNENSIVIPASVLFPPMYDDKRPWYLNFGAIGAIIGHEITHGFDNTGKDWDQNGLLNKNWWTPNFGKTFEKQAQCFVNQYAKYKVITTKVDGKKSLQENTTDNEEPPEDYFVDGNKTLAENIADNGGLEQTYLAYKMWQKKYGTEPGLPGLENYTNEQLLFISFGLTWCRRITVDLQAYLLVIDEHSPNRYRVIGSVSNSEEFSEAFGCKKSSPMNPEKKCTLW